MHYPAHAKCVSKYVTIKKANTPLFLRRASFLILPYHVSLLPEALGAVDGVGRGREADTFGGELVSAVGSSGRRFAQAGRAAH